MARILLWIPHHLWIQTQKFHWAKVFVSNIISQAFQRPTPTQAYRKLTPTQAYRRPTPTQACRRPTPGLPKAYHYLSPTKADPYLGRGSSFHPLLTVASLWNSSDPSCSLPVICIVQHLGCTPMKVCYRNKIQSINQIQTH